MNECFLDIMRFFFVSETKKNMGPEAKKNFYVLLS
jgi:hypothetical protein